MNASTIKSGHQRNYISLFSGWMGLDIGLERAGFNCVVCNEINALAVETIKLNKPALAVISDSVERVTLATLSEAAGFDVSGIDLLAGGPPCQAFSVFGQRRGLHDGRGRMIFEFFRLVDEDRPKAFLKENVRGLHSMPLVPKGIEVDGSYLPEHTEPGSLPRELIRLFESVGYRVDCYLVNSVNYGAPQIRERLLCIGSRFDIDPDFPAPEFSNRPSDKLPPFRTLGDVIGEGFSDPDPSMMNFSPRKLKYLAMVPPGGNWRNLPITVMLAGKLCRHQHIDTFMYQFLFGILEERAGRTIDFFDDSTLVYDNNAIYCCIKNSLQPKLGIMMIYHFIDLLFLNYSPSNFRISKDTSLL